MINKERQMEDGASIRDSTMESVGPAVRQISPIIGIYASQTELFHIIQQ
jgi:hypothetical protein